MTYHARKEMNDDGLTIYDVERGILTGAIMERQGDRTTGESKYRPEGLPSQGGTWKSLPNSAQRANW